MLDAPERFPYSGVMAERSKPTARRRRRTRRVRTDLINANKPQLWKADIAASVDQFNQWFMRFAPQAFRSTRVKTSEHVKAALRATRDLRNIDCATLQANPSS